MKFSEKAHQKKGINWIWYLYNKYKKLFQSIKALHQLLNQLILKSNKKLLNKFYKYQDFVKF